MIRQKRIPSHACFPVTAGSARRRVRDVATALWLIDQQSALVFPGDAGSQETGANREMRSSVRAVAGVCGPVARV
jgi:hypothetical protein